MTDRVSCLVSFCSILFLFALSPFALAEYDVKSDKNVTQLLQTIVSHNLDYVGRLNQNKPSFLSKQTPRATVVMCSDSRIQDQAFHPSSTNDLFVVRNIGNQIETAAGSVEYGVKHLKTPILMIIGHTHCGAIDAGLKDFSRESMLVRRELESLSLDHTRSLNENVLENIHHQVSQSMMHFRRLVRDKNLLILGFVYDLHNQFKQGHGRLILVNVNGETDKKHLTAMRILPEGIERFP